MNLYFFFFFLVHHAFCKSQTFLSWSKHVAAQDVSFVKGLVHSMMGSYSSETPSGFNSTRSRRSVDTQPQNAEEELWVPRHLLWLIVGISYISSFWSIAIRHVNKAFRDITSWCFGVIMTAFFGRFWWAAKLILDAAKTDPKLDLVVQSLFRTAFQIIKAAKETMYTLQGKTEIH